MSDAPFMRPGKTRIAFTVHGAHDVEVGGEYEVDRCVCGHDAWSVARYRLVANDDLAARPRLDLELRCWSCNATAVLEPREEPPSDRELLLEALNILAERARLRRTRPTSPAASSQMHDDWEAAADEIDRREAALLRRVGGARR